MRRPHNRCFGVTLQELRFEDYAKGNKGTAPSAALFGVPGIPGFGAPAPAAVSPFGTPSAAPAAVSPFGTPSAPSLVGAPAPAATPFGPFGAAPAATSPFGKKEKQPAFSPFGASTSPVSVARLFASE